MKKCPASWNLKWQVGYLDEEVPSIMRSKWQVGYLDEVPSIMKSEVTSWYLDEVPSIIKIWSDKLITLMKKWPASWNLKWQVDHLDEAPSIMNWQVDYLDEEVPSIMKCEVRSWLPWWRSPVPPAWHAPGPAPVWLWFGMRTAACALQRYLMNTMTSALTPAAYCQKMLVLFLQAPQNLVVTI